MTLLRDLWATSARRMAVVAAVILLAAAGQSVAAALAGPVLVRRSAALFVALAASLAVMVVGDVVVGLVVARLTADWSADVRRRLCRVAFGQGLPVLEATPVGELLDRIDGDVNQVAGELRGPGARVAQAAATGTLSIVTALVVWWPAGVAMLGLLALLGVVLARPIRRIGPARVLEEEAWSDVAAVMEEAVHGQDDVRTSLAQPYVLRLFARRAAETLRRGRRVWVLSAVVTTAATTVVRLVIAGVVVCGGAWALATGRTDPARLTSVWLLALAFGSTAEHISRGLPELQYAFGAWERVQVLRAAPQEPSGRRLPGDGNVEIRGLDFHYQDGGGGLEPAGRYRPAALRNVHLRFVRGRSYALVGRSGSGKSTLAKVLTRAVDVPRGTVRLGGVDLTDVDVDALRRWVAVVPQRTEVLVGTLEENITLFDDRLADAAEQAMRELGLDSWIADLPNGMRTRLGEGGYVLSAGQEQLVAFARILVRDPRVVILDEATARMDPVTEMRVHRATERLLAGRIGIVIAHRPSSVRRCDEVVVLAGGEVVEARPLVESAQFARLLATGEGGGAAVRGAAVRGAAVRGAGDDREGTVVVAERIVAGPARGTQIVVPERVEPPPAPTPPPAKALREIVRLATNDARYGLTAVVVFAFMTVLGLGGSVLPWLWADLVDGQGGLARPAAVLAAVLLVTVPLPYLAGRLFPEWWVRQMLRISLRLVHGQTGPRRVSGHTAAEVVAQGGDTERVVVLADNLVDQVIAVVMVVAMTVVSGSVVPAAFFTATMVVSGLAATGFGSVLERSARRTVAARAAFATMLASSLSAARTIKLAAATEPVLAHLGRLDVVRSSRQRREIAVQVWARSTPSVLSGLLPVGAWALYLGGQLSAGAVLVAVSTLGAARWFAWTTASLVSQLPSARVWTRRTTAMCGTAAYSAAVPGVDLSLGAAPGPAAPPRHELRRLELEGFSAVHDDGTVGVRDVDLMVERGQLVLVAGPVGSGKSSLLRALAGIVHHTGGLRWNGRPVTEPEVFLRPNQVGYVGQLPRVLSGTVRDNIGLGHDVDPDDAVTCAQLDHDLAAAGNGLGLVIGHKGTRLSGGQLQRLALARALAPETELLVTDDISSALDVTTELALWRALRDRRVTVIGSTSKRAALSQADVVVILVGGRVVARGRWEELAGEWGHLAG
jgi:ATP-binding cassette subfamily B protein